MYREIDDDGEVVAICAYDLKKVWALRYLFVILTLLIFVKFVSGF